MPIFLLFFLSYFLFAGSSKEEFPVPPPPLSEGIFPCSYCHADMELNWKKRILKEEHTNIRLRHGDRWCFDCHDPKDRDRLKLINGDKIEFTESYLLCGQCHGNIYRDWKKGIHGRRTGYLEGKKSYYLCVHCHDAHNPKFKSIKPELPPKRPLEK